MTGGVRVATVARCPTTTCEPVCSRSPSASRPSSGYLARELAVDDNGLRAMDHLLTSGPSTPTELADRLDISTAALSLVVQRLERAGHVDREPHPQDGRKVVITPGVESAARAEALVAPLISGVESLISDLSSADRAVVQSFLDRLLGVYDEATRHAVPGDRT